MPPTQDSQGLGSCSPPTPFPPTPSLTLGFSRERPLPSAKKNENPQGIRGGWGRSPWASLPAPLPRPTPVGAGVCTGGRPCSAHPGWSQCHQSQVHGNIMDRFCSPGPPNAGCVWGGVQGPLVPRALWCTVPQGTPVSEEVCWQAVWQLPSRTQLHVNLPTATPQSHIPCCTWPAGVSQDRPKPAQRATEDGSELSRGHKDSRPGPPGRVRE